MSRPLVNRTDGGTIELELLTRQGTLLARLCNLTWQSQHEVRFDARVEIHHHYDATLHSMPAWSGSEARTLIIESFESANDGALAVYDGLQTELVKCVVLRIAKSTKEVPFIAIDSDGSDDLVSVVLLGEP